MVMEIVERPGSYEAGIALRRVRRDALPEEIQ